jgi:hypothetical protein
MSDQDYETAAAAVFREASIASFAWLLDHGYGLTKDSPTFLQYRGPLGRVNVFLEHASEVGVTIAAPGEATRDYSIGLLMRMVHPEEAKVYHAPLAMSLADMPKEVTWQAERLKRCGERLFSGDGSVWDDLEREMELWWREFEAGPRLFDVLPEADRAFRQQNYKRVVELLSSVEARLLPDQHERLELARERLSPEQGAE